jgi:hypothetical protein
MPIAAFIAVLAAPSLSVVAKYAGPVGVAAYVVAVIAAVAVWRRFLHQRYLAVVTERLALRLAVATLLVALAAFALVFPAADAGAFGGGSDADDAIDVGARAWLRGEYPYYGRTYLGNPISPFPGALLLGLPFVIAGASALQGPFWLAVYFVFLRRRLGDTRCALLILWTMIGLSPVVLQELLVGTDHLPNAIYVLIPMTLLMSAAARAATPAGPRRSGASTWAVLLGVGLSSRPNFLLLLPLLFGSLARSRGFGRATGLTATVVASCAAVTLPFYLYDPAGFSPLHNVGTKLEQFHAGAPWMAALTPIAGGAAAALLAWRRASPDWHVVMGSAAIVQAIPVAIVVTLESAAGRGPFPASVSYGLHALPFAMIAAARDWSATPARPPVSRAARG